MSRTANFIVNLQRQVKCPSANQPNDAGPVHLRVLQCEVTRRFFFEMAAGFSVKRELTRTTGS
jgi:hypothetical protein